MFFSLLLALWMTYGVAGAFQSPLVPLRFIEEPTHTVARKNEAVTLNCRVEGSPSPTNITWEKDGQPITTDGRVRIGSDGALLISSMTHKREDRSDVGEYQCFASSPALAAGRIASRKAYLKVAGISKKFLYEPQSSTALVGSIARFSCKVRHAAPPAKITWEKDGSPLSSSNRLVILHQGVLQIKNVQKADEGNYRCIASNVAKTRYSEAASLTVQTGSDKDKMRLEFIGVPHNTTVLKGASTVLECAATGYPIPTVRWKRLNGDLRALKSSYGISNLNFTNISEFDGGLYECQASSNGQTISRTVWLFVRVPPQFKIKPVSFKWTTAKPILLNCAATGSPSPTISWLKNGNELISNEKARVTYYEGGAHLLISSETSSDSGMYQCFAQNEAGSIQASVSVIIHKSDDHPGPPTNLVALPYSSSSIVVSWSPPVGHYIITAYTLHYKKLDGGNDNEREEVLGSNTHRYIVPNLQPFTNYSFYVKAYTTAVGRDSKIIVQSTRQGSPTRPPMNVKVTSSTPDSLDVTWQPPPRGYQNGIITKYVINYGEIGQSLPSVLEVPGHILRRTINGLSKGRTYSIKMHAETVGGKGPLSKALNGTVLLHSTVVISAPTLWIAERNSSTLNVKWLPPKYGQNLVQRYHLIYVQLQGSKTEKGPFIVGRQQQSYSLTNLSSGSEFFIKVMAWNGKTLGQPGAVYAATDRDPHVTAGPHILPPSPPIHLVCHVRSSTSILLTWEHELSAERIAYYTVKYQLSDAGNSQPVEIRVPTEYANLDGLVRKKSYTISVRSHYEAGKNSFPGSISTTQVQCSIPARSGPSSPRNIKFQYKTVTSVKITWEAPVQRNGDLTGYEIFYTYNKTLPDSKWMVESIPLEFPVNYLKKFNTLLGIKENTSFYIKIRAANQDSYGPFCDTVIIKPPTTSNRVPPNVSYTIVSPRLVRLSWPCPRVFNAIVTSFTIRFTNNLDLPEDNWFMQTVVLGSSERFPSIVTTNMAVDQYTTYHIKVRAEYDDYIAGKWSKILKISTDGQGMNTSGTKKPRIGELEDNPEFNIKLGIIIGCTISAFCIVVLILFIVWRNPCRQVPANQGNEKPPGNGLPSLLPSHLQQVAVTGTQDNSGSTEETSASSGMCQCRCTCGANSRWPLGPAMVRANKKLPGSSDSTTPITRVFASSTPGGDSEGRLSHQELKSSKADGYNSGSSSTSTSVELHREDKVSSGSYKQSVSVDV